MGDKPSLNLTPPCLSTSQAGLQHRASALKQRTQTALSLTHHTSFDKFLEIGYCRKLNLSTIEQEYNWMD
jgi:hypothetical protein